MIDFREFTDKGDSMEFSELIEKRRSLRAYDPSVPVTREEIEKIVYAAQQAAKPGQQRSKHHKGQQFRQ